MTVLIGFLGLLPGIASGALYGAAGKVDVSPDPERDTVWLAGYGASGRRAKGVHDKLWARAFVLSDGKRTVAIVGVDSIGLFREDVLSWRRELGWTGGNQYLFVAATHSHSAPDTMGLWGRLPGVSGVNRGYRKRMREAVIGLVRDLAGRLREAELVAGRAEVDPRGLCWDDRDPVVIDPELQALRLKARGTGETLGTLVRWSCHPVTLTDENRLASADFPGPLCDSIEAKGGGTCVYLSGSVGGHLIPDTDRTLPVDRQYQDVKRIGERVAGEATAALAKGEPVSVERVDFSSAAVRVPVENSRYLAFLPSLAFGHKLLDRDGRPLSRWKIYTLPLRHLAFFPLSEARRPWIETEVSRVRIGSVQVLGVPAEVFPELVLGGYDGSRRYGHPLVGPANPNPPHLDRAPKGPYLRDRLNTRYGIVVSLANDELGYLVPEYDFQANPNRLMAPEPPGTHYEETNSIGPRATAILLNAYQSLLR